jgi:hypothetical protein
LKRLDTHKNCGTLKANNNKVHIILTSGILQLRKALALIRFIINNESIYDVKQTYVDKEKELKGRLANREDGKEEICIIFYYFRCWKQQ